MPVYRRGGLTDHNNAISKEDASGVITHAFQTIRDQKIIDIDAWLRQLATQPYKALEKLKSVTTIAKVVNGLAYDGRYLFALYTGSLPDSWGIARIDPRTMIDAGGGVSGTEGLPSSITFLQSGTGVTDGFLFVAVKSSPAKVIKIPVTGGVMGVFPYYTWTGAAGQNDARALTCDNSYVYVVLHSSPTLAVKIQISDMTTSATFDAGSIGNATNAHCVAYDGSYIYVSLDLSPARIVKIDKTTYAVDSIWEGDAAAYQTNAKSIVYASNYLYVACDPPGQTARIVKIYAASMATDSVYIGVGANNEYSPSAMVISSYDGSLNVAFNVTPGRVTQINPSDMSATGLYYNGRAGFPYYEEYFTSLAGSSSGDVLVGCYVAPAKVLWLLPGLTLHAVWTGAADEDNCTAVAADPSFTYAFAAYTNASGHSEVRKIITADMTSALSDPYSTGLTSVINKLIADMTYVFMTINVTGAPAKVRRITLAGMESPVTWTGASGQTNPICLIFGDNSNIYVAIHNDGVIPGRLYDLTTSSLTSNGNWTGTAVDLNPALSITYDGTWVYVGMDELIAKVYQVLASDMSLVGTWTGAYEQGPCQVLAFDGSYIYAGMKIGPAQVVKINPATMVTSLTWTGTVFQSMCLTCDGDYIYVGSSNVDGGYAIIVKVDTSTMLTVSAFASLVTGQYISALFDGLFIYFGDATGVTRKILMNVNDNS